LLERRREPGRRHVQRHRAAGQPPPQRPAAEREDNADDAEDEEDLAEPPRARAVQKAHTFGGRMAAAPRAPIKAHAVHSAPQESKTRARYGMPHALWGVPRPRPLSPDGGCTNARCGTNGRFAPAIRCISGQLAPRKSRKEGM